MRKGLFISVEGGEGVGKSTLIKGIARLFHQNSLPYVITREPGGTEIGKRIRSIFLSEENPSPPHPLTDLFLICADRAQHLSEVIVPALESGKTVLCDRFFDSTRAYQGNLGGLTSVQIESALNLSINNVVPDLTLLLDCPVAITEARLKARINQNAAEMRFDRAQLAHHQTIRDGFNAIARKFPVRIKKIDANQSSETILENAWSYLAPLMDPGND